jgi:hypothetical protein
MGFLCWHCEMDRTNHLNTRVSAEALLSLPPDQRGAILSAAAEHAAPLYDADLALPASQRELTAFTVLDGEAFLDGDV